MSFTVPTHTEPEARLNSAVARVLAQLPGEAPYVQPKHIAPLLGISENGFTSHCRNCRALKTWRGNYRFFLDDPGHMDALRAVVKLAIWSGRKLPAELKFTPGAPARVQ